MSSSRVLSKYDGVTILSGSKHTLSDEVASEATSSRGHRSWQVYKYADKTPFSASFAG